MNLAIVILLLVPVADFQATVTKVVDGDTIYVSRDNGSEVKVRLLLCDAPERDQPFGKEATEFVADLTLGKKVTIKSGKTDLYGRTLAEVVTPKGTNLNRELILQGMAHWFYHYNSDPEVGRLEVEAKAAKRGLWKQKNPIYPKNWRVRKTLFK